ncbi:TPA: amino acid permease [Legionella pneumophila subsp. pneumophila]|uniref:Amino acid permease/ SLC12A domain-containing protein n=1 Tax=Legionella pneumophila (strain Lens) TaxID=297245 RepID=Q5WXU2_LEGPL|nr:amino acid permease [Legionella pneumophila]AOW52379.1 amino acid permease [Legionella pneumophila subsp. pneumophila]AOW54032.1 amino acid permease [Legionella pneumophila subsp. pneumophila]AOW57670.1 amino acid permease [Legionella pneumophila subsp. pneumophila]AOW62149.1 amino acid permease [Legionella pneumophila subsp. pneumophila]AOW63175.1 amino acid permease [Legionella pneumophila subsp. pneumophila]
MKTNIPTLSKPIKDSGYRRGLKDRHVQLIALGGIIGSGYFLGTGEVINLVGPSVFIAYLLGGLIIYLTMLCMGELAVAIPISGSFVTYTSDFISPTVACGVGWSYWITWVAYIPAECVAGGIIMELFTGVSGYIWVVCFGLVITYINLAKVDTFGEIEFWLALIKIISLLAFVFLAILIFFGLIHGSEPPGIIGFKYLLDDGGLLPNGAMSLLTAMVLLLVNYQGSEIIGLAAGESENPARMIPHAIRNVTFRILFLYIIPVFCLVLIFPWQKAGLSNSVFADALNFYGLKWAGAVTSFVTLSATLSCANSGFYGAVRSLNALARDGMAPHVLAKFNQNSVPQNAVIATLIGVWILLGVGYFFGQTKLYIALLLVSGFTGTLAWLSLCIAQISFRNRLYKAGYSIKDLRYVTPYSPYTGILAVILMVGSLFFLLLNKDPIYKLSFIIGVVSFIIPVIIYKVFDLSKVRKKALHVKSRVKFQDLFPPQ